MLLRLLLPPLQGLDEELITVCPNQASLDSTKKLRKEGKKGVFLFMHKRTYTFNVLIKD